MVEGDDVTRVGGIDPRLDLLRHFEGWRDDILYLRDPEWGTQGQEQRNAKSAVPPRPQHVVSDDRPEAMRHEHNRSGGAL
jgi:hypothetical protein